MTATEQVVQAIRDAGTMEEAVDLFKSATTPKRKTNRPPSFDEVMEFARDQAIKMDEDVSYLLLQAEQAFEFYTSNMQVMDATTWKDGSGNPVKNWKLKIKNNWFNR